MYFRFRSCDAVCYIVPAVSDCPITTLEVPAAFSQAVKMETILIDIKPCSTAPSTPTSECEQIDSYFDSESNKTSSSSCKEQPTPRSVVQILVDSLNAAYQAQEVYAAIPVSGD
jgi:hypothetical protein